ncbi:unnamed protein product [Nippostrongylus brasiliensis]|uniref:Acyl_transf_3 domain-containing protein n=1 Tax=Nippostrongylus brasiliensis TaxID=27835 RepID=A0A0N4YL15_NIPBR|nr:unnamed protein product [Nippostrongylus brasiliensis]
MDHPIWQPLGRLSYCAYIVHYVIIHYVYNLDDRPSHFVSTWESYVHRGIPIFVFSYIGAFFWSCLFELPVVKLEKMLMDALTSKRTRKPRIHQTPQPLDNTGKVESIGGLRL